jgi:hypothetical protein
MAANQFGGPGGSLGTVYNGQEGVDKAFVLGESDDALKAFTELTDDIQANQKVKALEEKKAIAAKEQVKEKLKTSIPEFFWKHDTELGGRADKIMQYGADLLAAGIDDPFSSNAPEAQLFKKELESLGTDAKLSMQIKGRYDLDRKDIIDDKEGKYTDESKVALLKWYDENPLSNIQKDGMLPPGLDVARPEFERTKFYGAWSKEIAAGNPNPDDPQFDELVSQALTDPSKKEYVRTLQTDVKNLKASNPTLFAELEKQAKEKGIPVEVLVGKQQLKSYFGAEKFNFEASIKDFLPKVDVQKAKFENEKGVTSWRNIKELSDEKLTAAADSYLTLNSGAIEYFKKSTANLPDDLKVTDYPSALKKVKQYMKAQVETEIDTGTSREEFKGVDGSGKTLEEINSDHDNWRKTMMGLTGDPNNPEDVRIRRNTALDYIAGSTVPGLGVISEAYIPAFSEGEIMFEGLGIKIQMPSGLNEKQKATLRDGAEDKIVVKVKKTGAKETIKGQEDVDGTLFDVTKTGPTDDYEYVIYDLSGNVDDPNNGIRSATSGITSLWHKEGVANRKKLFIETEKEQIENENKKLEEISKKNEAANKKPNTPVFDKNVKKKF